MSSPRSIEGGYTRYRRECMETQADAAGRGNAVVYRIAAVCAVAPLAALIFDIAASLAYGAAPTAERGARAWL
jgi:hypothetical protein